MMFDPDNMNRRAMMARIAMLLGVSALPLEALDAATAPKRKSAPPAGQLALIAAVADTILPTTDTPGAVAAKVPAKLSGMLTNWASAKTRDEILAALGRIDAAAKTQMGKGFAALTAAERAALLKPHDAAALKTVPPPPGAPKASLFAPAVHVADKGYYRFKDLVIALYYFSEVGTANELAYVHVPGVYKPSVKLTPQSRPELGTGPF